MGASSVEPSVARATGSAATFALVRAAQAHAPHSRDALIQACMPPIAGVARLFRATPAVDRAELMQEGVVGLLRALERFDPALGTPFWAYATWWVRQAMQQLVAERGRPVALSDRAARELARVKQCEREQLQFHGRHPTLDELACAAGLTRVHVERLLAVDRPPWALDAPDAGTASSDRIPDPRAEDALEAGAIDKLRETVAGAPS